MFCYIDSEITKRFIWRYVFIVNANTAAQKNLTNSATNLRWWTRAEDNRFISQILKANIN